MTLPILLPDLGEGIVEAEVERWLVKPGDAVAAEQPVVEVMTDKATVVIPAPRAGRVARLLVPEGEIAHIHAPLLELDVEGEVAPPSGTALPAAGHGRASATPAVRAEARRRGIDLDTVKGSGPGGRVRLEDLGPPDAPPAAPSAAPAAGRIEVLPMRGLRRRIAERMALSHRSVAPFTFVEEVDVTALAGARERAAARAGEAGSALTFLPFIVKAVVAALREHPTLNASLDEEKGEVLVKRWYDIGIATATEDGLMVPVVRRADVLPLLDLAKEIVRVTGEAKARRGAPSDQGGSTFTVTSLGALGGLLATPVINPPEVAILGVHRIRPTPVVRDGQVVVRDVMHLSLTSDHRVVDGDRAAAFTYAVIRYLEDPSLLFGEEPG